VTCSASDDHSRRFQRTVEDFECERCGTPAAGSGFTNHCPSCLWSKHVDVHPGDRQAECGGLMEPVAVETERDEYRIVHRCLDCGLERRNRAAAGDDFEELLRIAASS
jgi:hypothetical protein